MSISPVITFKAGQCHLDTSSKPHKVTPDPTPGYIYLYPEDECIHFCWRKRDKLVTEPDLDLLMFPTDGQFEPYEYQTNRPPASKTNGRIFVLKFSSSSARHLFWLQSKPQARNGDPAWFSPRDLKIGQIVDTMLQGDEVNVEEEIATVQGNDDGDIDGDEAMEDIEGHGTGDSSRGAGGGAGPGATGGDIREEGAGAREGGADGGRAAQSGPVDTTTVVQNFLQSLQGNAMQQQPPGEFFATLPDLLPTSTTVPIVDSLNVSQVNEMLRCLPPVILVLEQNEDTDVEGMAEPNVETTNNAIATLELERKRDIIKRVLRSPQFHQSLVSLTIALRDGGLPSIAEALGVPIDNGGLVAGGSVPLGGGTAVKAFIRGVKKANSDTKGHRL